MKFGFRRPRAIAKEVQLQKSNPDEHGHPQNCLNCEAELVGAYCHVCGQSAHTHRMSFKHFLLHDFVHGIWHLDKGFPATLKKAFVNPGKEIRVYLAGKRVGWFSILTMVFLLIAFNGYVESKLPDDGLEYKEESQRIINFIQHNSKWILLAICFVFSCTSFLLFRRVKLNFSEHIVVNSFLLIGLLAINLVDSVFQFFQFYNEDLSTLSTIVLMSVYIIYAYYGAFKNAYTFFGWLWRFLLHSLLSSVLIIAILTFSLFLYIWTTGKQKIEIDTIHKVESKKVPIH